MINKHKVYLTVTIVIGLTIAFILVGGPWEQAVQGKNAAIQKVIDERAAQEAFWIKEARSKVIALPLDEGTKNYYLHRLDEQQQGYYGGASGAKDTVAEAQSRATKAREQAKP